MININPEKKHPLLQKCAVLKEYSQFISTVRKSIANSGSLEDAVKYCIKNDILKDYLLRKSSEVTNMLITEYDYDMDISVQREEAAEKAVEINNQLNDQIWTTILHNPTLSAENIAQMTKAPIDRVRKIMNILQNSGYTK